MWGQSHSEERETTTNDQTVRPNAAEPVPLSNTTKPDSEHDKPEQGVFVFQAANKASNPDDVNSDNIRVIRKRKADAA